MSSSNLDRLVEEVKTLTPDEQRSLRDIVEGLLATSVPRISEEEFEQRLLEKGIISRIPSPITDLTPYRNRKLIEVKGKPLSETIIEDRRNARLNRQRDLSSSESWPAGIRCGSIGGRS